MIKNHLLSADNARKAHLMLSIISSRRFGVRLFLVVWLAGTFCFDLAALSPYAQKAVLARRTKRRREPIVDVIFESLNKEQGSFLGATELKELEIPIVHYQLDYAMTSFGRWQLKQFLFPTADVTTIMHRQEVVKALLNDPEFFACAQKALPYVAESEDALIAYWNENDSLSHKAADLYYTFPWIENVNGYLNDSKTALDWGMLLKTIRRCDSLFVELCKVSFAKELLKLSIGVTNNVSLEGMLLNNAKSLFRGHVPWYVRYDEHKYLGTQAQYSDLMENGSLADRWAAFLRGATFDDGKVEILQEDGWLKAGWDNTAGALWGATFGQLFPDFSLAYKWSSEQAQNISDASLAKKGFVALAVVGYTAYLDYALYTGSRDSFTSIKSLFGTMDALRARLIDVVRALHAIRALERYVALHPTISDYPFAHKMKQVRAENVSQKLKALLEMLDEKTFKGDEAWIYSRGRVLLAHKILLEIKDELVPVLEAVAEFDAYVSIATLMQEHEQKNARFCFVEFVDANEPILDIQACWVPMLMPERAVVNDIKFGIDGQPNKWVITGPNGGGKSTFLKAVGHAVILGHGFGIMPAQRARIAPLAGLRTCLRPEESLLDDMSQFMAEKKRMDEMLQFVQESSEAQKVVALIDEPFRGTVDAESAERIYSFGQKVAQRPGSIVCIATHVEKPVGLAQQMPGIFGNCHVGIAEHADGTFERLFTVQLGCEHWWFDDAGKRSRFIDWLSTEYSQKKASETSKSA
jgi:hypothetical protein